MLDFDIEKVHFDKTYCLCGCGKTIHQGHWGLKLKMKGSIQTFEQSLALIEKLEQNINNLNILTNVCKKCGECCSYAPEISAMELTYFLEKFPENEDLYRQIIPAIPCPLGGIEKGPCKLEYYSRPLQCRMLNCQANIIGFETFYNHLADFLGWSRLRIDNLSLLSG